jgi:hypothetical protein
VSPPTIVIYESATLHHCAGPLPEHPLSQHQNGVVPRNYDGLSAGPH